MFPWIFQLYMEKSFSALKKGLHDSQGFPQSVGTHNKAVKEDLHFAGKLYPPVILASPVSQPLRVTHSALRPEPADAWIAPSTEI